MKLNILCLREYVTDLATLNAGISLAETWSSTIGLSFNFTFKDITTQFTSIPISNSFYLNGHVVNPTEIFTEAKSFGIPFDIDLLVYDWTKITPQPVCPFDGGMNLQIPIQWYVTYPEVFAEFFLHELCHYFFAGQSKLPDITHLLVDGTMQAQYPQLYAQFKQGQVKDYYLYLLKQFMPKVDLTITRQPSTPTETLGQLITTDGKFGCFTLERPWLNNQLNISCIPTGIYTAIWTLQPDLNEWHYELQNTGVRTGIFIHEGDTVLNTKGCILLGGLEIGANLGNSSIIVKAFEAKFNKMPITIEIK